MKVMLIIIAIGVTLYTIDILICKINPKIGFLVAIFNLPLFPIGLITFILTQKYLEKELDTCNVTQYFAAQSSAKNKNKYKQTQKTPVTNYIKPSKKTSANTRSSINTDKPNLQGVLSIIIEEGPKIISRREFESRKAIGSVVIPEGVEIIEEYAFAHCSALRTVVLPKSLKIIHERAFYDCNNLTNIIIPDTVCKISDCAFENCNKLDDATLEKINSKISDFSCEITAANINTQKNTKSAPDENEADKLLSVIIEKGATRICHSAFKFCKHIVSLVIPDGVELIDEEAFKSCRRLTSVVIPNSVTRIREGAFSYCIRLKKAEIPNRIKIIEKDAFYFCTELSAVTIPEGVHTIEKTAFAYCKGLTRITLPNSLKRIYAYAFTECTNLISITFGNKLCDINPTSFHNCCSLDAQTQKIITENILPPTEDITSIPLGYSNPYDDPNYDISGEGLDPNKYIYEKRRTSDGKIYTVVFSRLDYPGDKSQDKTSIKKNKPKEKKQNISFSTSTYTTPKNDPYYVSNDYFNNDPDYQDYLQGNIRPERYKIEHWVTRNGQEYTTLKSEKTELARYYREQNQKHTKSEAVQGDNKHSELYRRYQQYIKKHPEITFETYEKDVKNARLMEYETPHNDPELKISIDPTDSKWLHPKHPIEQRLAKNGEWYWVEV